MILDKRENSAPPGQSGCRSDPLTLHRFVENRDRIGCIAGWLYSLLICKYLKEYRELVAERDVHYQTKCGARLALVSNRISQESQSGLCHQSGPRRSPYALP